MNEKIPGGIQRLIDSSLSADLFMTPQEKAEREKYLAAFSEESQRLGPGHDEDAVLVAKSRVPMGYEADAKWNKMLDGFMSGDKV